MELVGYPVVVRDCSQVGDKNVADVEVFDNDCHLVQGLLINILKGIIKGTYKII